MLHQDASLSTATVGWLSAGPFAVSIVAMQILTRWSDRLRDGRTFAAIPILLGGISLLVAAICTGPGL